LSATSLRRIRTGAGRQSRKPDVAMHRALTAREAALWRRVAETARPLVGKTLPAERHALPREPARLPSPAAPPHPPATIEDPRPLADRGGERRVRRGRLDIDARLDLHGFTQDRARAALLSHVARQRAQGARVLLAITGKSGVLRLRLPEWMAGSDFRAHLAGYAQAHIRHGGEGAWYLFLKRR
jgi:DNA-nicking Smr family endonuclease